MTDFSATLPHTATSLTRTQLRENVRYLVQQPMPQLRDYQDILKTEIGYLAYRSENHESASVRKRADADLAIAQARFEMAVDAVLTKLS